MIGVDEFRSMTQARSSQEKATRRLVKATQGIIPAIILSVLTLLLYKFSSANNRPLEILSVITLLGTLILLTYAEAWFYIGQLTILPFRKFGIFFGLIAFLFYFAPCIIATTFTPICPLLYEMYLCKITLECTKDYV